MFAGDQGAQALVLLTARRAALEMGAQPRNRSVGIGARQLELDVAVELVEADLSADLLLGRAEQAAERGLQIRTFGHRASPRCSSSGNPESSRCVRSFRRASCRVL